MRDRSLGVTVESLTLGVGAPVGVSLRCFEQLAAVRDRGSRAGRLELDTPHVLTRPLLVLRGRAVTRPGDETSENEYK